MAGNFDLFGLIVGFIVVSVMTWAAIDAFSGTVKVAPNSEGAQLLQQLASRFGLSIGGAGLVVAALGCPVATSN